MSTRTGFVRWRKQTVRSLGSGKMTNVLVALEVNDDVKPVKVSNCRLMFILKLSLSFFSLGLGVHTRPNIYTFPCPYCPNKNLDREDLLRHVLGLHKDDTAKVVRIERYCRRNPDFICESLNRYIP